MSRLFGGFRIVKDGGSLWIGRGVITGIVGAGVLLIVGNLK